MQRMAVGGERALSLALSLLMVVGTVAPAFAAAPVSSSTETRLEKIENSLLSRTQKGMSEADRLSTLEKRVFGSEKTGSVSERLAPSVKRKPRSPIVSDRAGRKSSPNSVPASSTSPAKVRR